MVRVASLREWADKTGESLHDIVRSSALQISASVVKKTPVDTGRAKGNWIATIGSSAGFTTEKKEASTLGAISTGQQSEILDVISEMVGKKFYFVNNLPYINRLEYDSWSQQAPAGMLRISVKQFESGLQKAIRENT